MLSAQISKNSHTGNWSLMGTFRQYRFASFVPHLVERYVHAADRTGRQRRK